MTATCGTNAGYQAHRRRGEYACTACRAAAAAYQRARRALAPSAPTPVRVAGPLTHLTTCAHPTRHGPCTKVADHDGRHGISTLTRTP